ncbi:hypothetical protein FV218_06490 [Methylobacterium sp. WL69]|uniref:hypothetical protein n=1 Tax=Methylobacterium sp. WL69 TaxID=2603893 RepID=UPI0011C8465C|nr:hypothetical protein [Methylobacterium sp. WL69]TXM76591.1 hypothetical protein FV218_06490 [Methylobacterium sp. WL69]
MALPAAIPLFLITQFGGNQLVSFDMENYRSVRYSAKRFFMASDDEFRDCSDHSTDRARQIAQILGCPLEALSGPTFSWFDQTGELLRIWSTIAHEQDRKKVLSFVRMIADQAADQQGT